MRKRTFLLGFATWSAVWGKGAVADDRVHFEGFLVFDRKVQFSTGTSISVYATHSWGIQHGNGFIVREDAEIANSNLPWGFKLAASAMDVLADDHDIIISATVREADGNSLFAGGIRKPPRDMISNRQRIEMMYLEA